MKRAFTTVWKEVEVDVYLSDFDDEELEKELIGRGYSVHKPTDPISKEGLEDTIHDLFKDYIEERESFDKRLKDFFYKTIGMYAL